MIIKALGDDSKRFHVITANECPTSNKEPQNIEVNLDIGLVRRTRLWQAGIPCWVFCGSGHFRNLNDRGAELMVMSK